MIMHFRLCVSSICLPPASLQALTRKKIWKGAFIFFYIGSGRPFPCRYASWMSRYSGPLQSFSQRHAHDYDDDMQWHRLSRARGHVIPLGTGEGTVSRRTANKKLTKLYCPPGKRSPKRLFVLVEPKKWRGTCPPPLLNSFRRH